MVDKSLQVLTQLLLSSHNSLEGFHGRSVVSSMEVDNDKKKLNARINPMYEALLISPGPYFSPGRSSTIDSD